MFNYSELALSLNLDRSGILLPFVLRYFSGSCPEAMLRNPSWLIKWILLQVFQYEISVQQPLLWVITNQPSWGLSHQLNFHCRRRSHQIASLLFGAPLADYHRSLVLGRKSFSWLITLFLRIEAVWQLRGLIYTGRPYANRVVTWRIHLGKTCLTLYKLILFVDDGIVIRFLRLRKCCLFLEQHLYIPRWHNSAQPPLRINRRIIKAIFLQLLNPFVPPFLSHPELLQFSYAFFLGVEFIVEFLVEVNFLSIFPHRICLHINQANLRYLSCDISVEIINTQWLGLSLVHLVSCCEIRLRCILAIIEFVWTWFDAFGSFPRGQWPCCFLNDYLLIFFILALLEISFELWDL